MYFKKLNIKKKNFMKFDNFLSLLDAELREQKSAEEENESRKNSVTTEV